MPHSYLVAVALAGLLVVDGRAGAQQPPSTSIVGVWTLNKDKSDQPPAEPKPGDQEGRGRGGRGGSGGAGGSGGGGFGGGGGGRGGGRGGGGFGRGGDGGGGGRGNPEETQRMRDAMRDIMQPAERMTIVRTESMVIITTGDGRTTRLATDGSKVKDDSTGIERKTHWEGDHLVSEISGAIRGKIVETWALDPASHQLAVTLQMDAGKKGQGDSAAGGSGGPVAGLRHHIYDPQQQP